MSATFADARKLLANGRVMQVIGHRGALHEALENSFASFDKAVEIGCERIEFDVGLCKDGSIMVMHDDDLERTTGFRGLLKDMTRDSTSQVKLNNGEAVPFFDELCQRYIEKIEFNVELKTAEPDLIDGVCNLMRQFSRRKRCILSSFHPEALVYAAAEQPDFEVAVLLEGVPHWPNLGVASPLLLMEQVGTNIIHPWSAMVDENFMDQARVRGWQVFPWTTMAGDEEIDREKVWITLKTLGVDGLCSNYPRELKQWLEENGNAFA